MAVAQHQPVIGPAGRVPTAVTVAAGWLFLIVAVMATAVLVPPDQVVTRALMMAVVAGLFAARVANRRAVAAVTVLNVLTFVGFLANEYGELTGDEDAWTFAAVIVFAAALGGAYRYMCSLHLSADAWPESQEPGYGTDRRHAR